MSSRRQFLSLSASSFGAALAAGALRGRRALAATRNDHLKFIFIFNRGGWDPTRVFATEFDNPEVDLEADAQLGTAGGLSFVDHAGRPSVRSFFETWHERTLIINGILVPSVAHDPCRKLMLTGSTADQWRRICALVWIWWAQPTSC